jgi:hypothetical protein
LKKGKAFWKSNIELGLKFCHGFWAAGLTKAANVNNLVGTEQSVNWDFAIIAVAATLGGTISKITGGKFGNGAVTAGFAQMLNGNASAKRLEQRKAYDNSKIINDTDDAIERYFKGDGSPAELSDDVKQKIKNHPTVQDQMAKNASGQGKPPNRLDLDLTDDRSTYHIGATKVIYTDSCSGSSCTTNFTAPIFDQQGNPDMFYDPINLGFELPEGTPYQYKTFDWSVSYPNP